MSRYPSPDFIDREGNKYFEGNSVRAYFICGPLLKTLKDGDNIPETSKYRLEVYDGQIGFSPERGYYSFKSYCGKKYCRLYEVDKLEKF